MHCADHMKPMKPIMKSLLLGIAQLALVASLGGKLIYDRATQPRVWARTMPYDPDLPIRGRYVRLRVEVAVDRAIDRATTMTLHAQEGKLRGLIASAPNETNAQSIVIETRNGEPVVVLAGSVAFFIPEHIPDPSIRPHGEELWVEVTLPKRGPPRPIRLGIKTEQGDIQPLDLD